MSQGSIVLVNDDSESLNLLLRLVTEAVGAEQEILLAGSSEEGLGVLYRIRNEGKHLDMVITHQSLPGISGTRFLEILHSQFPGVIKILVSDRPSLEEAVYAFNNAGLDRYIASPWQPEDIKFTVTSLLRQAAMRRTNERLLLDLQKRNAELNNALRELKEAKQEVENSYLSAVQSLAVALEAKDRCTSGHSQRVSRFATMIARGLSLPALEVRTIGQIGLLHDIGKIGMDDKILNKPGRPTDREWEELKIHPQLGIDVVHRAGFDESTNRKTLGRGVPRRVRRGNGNGDGTDRFFRHRVRGSGHRDAQIIGYLVIEQGICGGNGFRVAA